MPNNVRQYPYLRPFAQRLLNKSSLEAWLSLIMHDLYTILLGQLPLIITKICAKFLPHWAKTSTEKSKKCKKLINYACNSLIMHDPHTILFS